MDLKHENIHEYRVVCNNTVQITLDDDFNVTDSKPDIDTVIKEWGNVVIDGVKTTQDKAQVEGKLNFSLLYMGKREADGRHLPVRMEGKLNFLEGVNLSCDAGDDYVTCKAAIEDLTIKAINSRKISVKAIISLTIVCEQLNDICITTGVTGDDDCMPQVLEGELEYVQLAVNMRDNFRIRENVNIPMGKPDIKELVWDDVDIRNMNTRFTEEGLSISGDLCIFVMYLAMDDIQSIQWYETSVPFSGVVDISGCQPECISYVGFTILNRNVEARSDYDGESRDISVEMVLDLDIKAYEECSRKAVIDMYSPVQEIHLKQGKEYLRKLLIRNNSKCRISGIIKVDEYINLLQIVNSTATVQIDDYTKEEDGLLVDGAVIVNVFYITSDDMAPMGSVKSVIPFSNKILIRDCSENNIEYYVRAQLEQLSASMNSSAQIEVKACVSLDAIVFQPFEMNVIEECESGDKDSERYAKFPAMVGYIADGNSRLWDIAKKYHTTCSSIRSGNPKVTERILDSNTVPKGTKLLLVKTS